MTSLSPCKSVLCFSSGCAQKIASIGNVAIDSLSTPKSAVTVVGSAVLVSQMALLIQQTGAALVYSQLEQAFS